MSKQERNRIKQILVIMIFGWFLILGFNYLIELPGSKADQLCPITDTVHGTVTLQPENGNNVIDCSAQDVVIASDGELVVERYYTANGSRDGDGGAVLLVRNLTVETGGKITATGKGYQPGESDNGSGNAVASTDNVGGSGGGYGGAGGEGKGNGVDLPGDTGTAYGDTYQPILLGGAGGNSGLSTGGNGGGAIKILASELVTIDGTIEANGLNGKSSSLTAGGGGAGGSIWIEAESLAGNGLVEAKGGGTTDNVSYPGGGGGGGRIIMYCRTSKTFTGSVSVAPGLVENAQDGGAGTLIGPTCIPFAPTTLRQFMANGTTSLPVGGVTNETTIVFAADLVDPDISETLILQVEVRPLGTPFINIPTNSQTIGVSNPQNCTSGSSFDCGRVTVTNMPRSTQYHWQARVKDSKGGLGPWTIFGNNTEEEIDVLVAGIPTTISNISGNNQEATVANNLSAPLVVKVADSNGVGVPGQTVSWQVVNASGGGVFLNGATSVTNMEGLASNTYKVGTIAGTNQVRAVFVGLSGSPVNFYATGLADAIHHFDITAPQYAIVNQPFGDVTIVAKDQYNNSILNYAGNPTLTVVSPVSPYNALAGVIDPTSIQFLSQAVYVINNISYDTVESIKLQLQDGTAIGRSNTIAVVNSLGSCPDADGIIDVNQTWTATAENKGIFDCSAFHVQVINNAILTLVSYDSGDTIYTNDYNTQVLAANLTVAAGSKISADNTGYQSGRGPGAGTGGYCWAVAPSYGGYGAAGSGGANIYGSVYEPADLGSASGTQYGGTGGGGGIKLIVAGTTTIDGTVSANGGNTSGDCNTGGSGGSIWIDTQHLTGASTMLMSTKGMPGNGKSQGAGGAGRIALYYATTDIDLGAYITSNKIQAIGSTSGSVSGPGTIYLEQKGVHNSKGGKLYVDNNSQNGQSAGLLEDSYSFEHINLTKQGKLLIKGNNSRLTFDQSTDLGGDTTAPSLKVEGTINYIGDGNLNINGVNLTVGGDLIGVNNIVLGDVLTGKLTIYANTWAHNSTNQYNYSSINVAGSGSLILSSYDNGNTTYTDDYGVTMNVTNFTVAQGGVVTANGLGYQSGRGPGAGSGGYCWAVAPSYGGYGAGSSGQANIYGSVYEPYDLGSASGTQYGGTGGGGAIKLNIAGTLSVNGTISSNGGNTSGDCNTGGSGGSIWIDANNFTGSSTMLISANGSPGNGKSQGAGGAGRIALYYSNTDLNLNTYITSNNIRATGSTSGYVSGPGTIYLEQKEIDILRGGKLYADNVNQNGQYAGLVPGAYNFSLISLTKKGHLKVNGDSSFLTLTTSSGATGDSSFPTLSVAGTITYLGAGALEVNGVNLAVGGDITGVEDFLIGNSMAAGVTLYAHTWAHDATNQYTFGSIKVASLGTLTLASYDSGDTVYTNDYGVTLNVTDLEVATGGVITANNQGYQSARGPGAGGGGYCYATAPSYGGYGSGSSGQANIYGSVYEPSDLGSASGTQYGGTGGGGAIKLNVGGTLTLNGTITSNGGTTSGDCNTGGTGGSIWIDANNMTGSSTMLISANGSPGNGKSQGAGGAGRIAVYYSSSDLDLESYVLSNRIRATGSTSGYISGAGTIYLENKGVDTVKGAKLYVDNLNQNGQSAGLVEDSYNFSMISLTKKGHLKINGNSSLLTLSTSTGVTGDSSFPTLTVDGTITYIGEGALEVNGVNLAVGGDITGVEDFLIGNSMAAGVTLYAHTWAHDATNQYTFGSIKVDSLGTLTLASYDSGDTVYTNDYGVTLNVTDLEVATGGVITANNQGYQSARGPGAGGGGYCYATAPSYGGYGSGSSGQANIYGSVYEPSDLGSASGTQYGGTGGGGAIKLNVGGTLTLNGTITSNGGTTSGDCNTGGTGGSIWIDANNMTGSSTMLISANGSPGNGKSQGAGGAGRIAVYYSSSDLDLESYVLSNRIRATGSTSGYISGAGTIYLENKGVDTVKGAKLYVDNLNQNGQYAGLSEADYQFDKILLTKYGKLKVAGQNSTLTIDASSDVQGDGTFPDIAVEGTFIYTGSDPLELNGINLNVLGEISGLTDLVIGKITPAKVTLHANTWAHDKDNQYSFNSIDLGPTGKIDLWSYDSGDTSYTNDYGVTIDVADLTVDSGAIISSNGMGYQDGRGPGAGSGGYCYATAPSYGGFGAATSGKANTYGNIYTPTDLGSASGTQYGGTGGGGAIKLNVTNTLNLNGTITSNGGTSSGDCNTGGAGGSIFIEAEYFTGSDSMLISANGSPGNGNSQGAGGAGRIALYYATTNLDFETQVLNHRIRATGISSAGYNSGPGSIYIEDRTNYNPLQGDLYIDNNALSSIATDFAAQDYNFNNVYFGPNLNIKIPGNTETNSGTIFNLTGDFYLASGSTIDGVGLGHPSSSGPGSGSDATLMNGGGGAAYGGNGGDGESSDGVTVTYGGEKYGDQIFPFSLGSGGGKGGTGALGGNGGGAFAVVAPNSNISIYGNINVSGTNGLIGSPGGGGGSGGSVLLQSNSCSIAGNIIADGGDGGDGDFDGGGGGGGRVALIRKYGTCELTGTVSVEMGASLSGQVGQIGTYSGVVTLPFLENENQAKLTGEIIPVGSVISEDQVKLSVEIADPGASESNPINLVTEFQIVEISHDFTDTVNVIEINSNAVEHIGGAAEPVTVTVDSGLDIGSDYKWRARVLNVDDNIVSYWTEFGANGNEADFSITSTDHFDVQVDKVSVDVMEPINVVVTALNSLNDRVQDYFGTIAFSYTPESDPGPNLPSNYTFGIGDQGQHSFTDELMFFSPGIYQIIVTDINNPSINGYSLEITVIGPPPTPTPTQTPIPSDTPTPIPGISVTVTPYGDEVSPTPSTDNVLVSLIPTTLDEEERDCFEDPLQPKCQVNVVISNVRVTVDNENLSSQICFDTNIATVGVIKYGTESYTDSSEVEKTYRVKNHCMTLDNLASAMGYIFKIEAVSYAGKRGSYEGTFVTEGGVTLVVVDPKECIVVNSTSFTDDHRAVLDFETSGPALCQVSYGALGGPFADNLPKDNEELIKHRSYLELIKIEPYTDLMYRILCEVKDGDKVNSCEVMDVISWNKIKTYYPEEGYRNWQWNELVGRIGEGLPFVGISFLGFMMLANLFAFPQLPLYGLFVLRRKKRGNPWGVVYDKEKKIPVSFAVLRLFDNTGKLIEQSVSNLEGKYGFVVDKGHYRLEVVQSGYQSTIREVKVLENETVISEDIGLSRKTPTSMRINLKQQISVLTKYLVYIGFVISLVAWLISPEPLNLIILLLYIGQAIYLWSMRMKDFGVVKSGILKMKGVFVRVYDIEQGRQIEVGMSDSKGRYQIPVKPGRYLLGAYTPGYELAEQPTLITKNGQKFLEIKVAGDKVREEIELRQV